MLLPQILLAQLKMNIINDFSIFRGLEKFKEIMFIELHKILLHFLEINKEIFLLSEPFPKPS
jgi:hypothetical protein